MNLHPWFRHQFRKRPRIYIMPTRMGGYLNGLIFLMFFLAVGYSNNLLLIFTLFLFGLNLVWVIQTHFHLHHLKLESVSIEEGHAGEQLEVKVQWKNSPDGPHSWNITLEAGNDAYEVKSLHHDASSTIGHFTLPKRGVWEFGHIKIKSEMPFGLYVAWTFQKIGTKVWVYPAKLKEIPPLPRIPDEIEGEHASSRPGPHDVWNLTPYQLEEARKISWKHYARSGELVAKEGEELTKSLVLFKLRRESPDKEFLLSVMASQMVLCTQTETPFVLEHSGKKTGPGISRKHLGDCLRELAKC